MLLYLENLSNFMLIEEPNWLSVLQQVCAVGLFYNTVTMLSILKPLVYSHALMALLSNGIIKTQLAKLIEALQITLPKHCHQSVYISNPLFLELISSHPLR